MNAADLEDDFGLRDEDFLPQENAQASGPQDATGGDDDDVEVMEVDGSSQRAPATEEIRPGAIFIKGVDDLSTKDVQSYVLEYLKDEEFRIEWINDTSVNIVFMSQGITRNALQALTSEAVYYDGDTYEDTQLRDAKTHPDKRGAKLQVRYSVQSDRKEKKSRQKSRYYLFHGEPKFEDERFRFTHKKSRDDEEQSLANRFGYKAYTEEDDLFPNKLIETEEGKNDNDSEDLFPEKVKGSRSTGSDLDQGYRTRETSGQKNRRNRSRSPGGRSSDLASRIGPKWVKGENLGQNDKRGRRKAADMF